MRNYIKARDVFIDSIDLNSYVSIDSNKLIYNSLAGSLERVFKILLITGKPGTGKSLLLNRLYHGEKKQKEIYLFDIPPSDTKEFYSRLFKILTSHDLPAGARVDLETLTNYLKASAPTRNIILLLDEVQMYSSEILEKIRIISDIGSIKFILSFHQTKGDNLLAQEHFSSRILETKKLLNANKDEMKIYIYQKLLIAGQLEIADMISSKSISLIYRLTSGNYREVNKIMYTTFEIYSYYSLNFPHKISKDKFSMKIIEMAAIQLGYIHD